MSGFGRSNSLSINTGRSLFPSTATQPQPTSSLFGSAPAASQPQQSGGLLGTSQPQQGGGLFGSLSNTSQPQQSSGSLFGSQAATAQTGGGLPGMASAQTQQQQPTSLFGGSTLGKTQGLDQSQPQSGSFGGIGASSKPTLSSLFGTQNQSTQQKPSLFSPTAMSTGSTQNQPSLFGNMTQAAAPTSSLLGSRLGGGLLGQSGQASSIPGVKIDAAHMRGTTRFNDLHDDLQKQIEQADNFIQQQISFAAQCSAILPAHGQNISYIPNDSEYLQHKADTVELALDNDSTSIAKLKDVVVQDIEDARQVFRVVENLKLPQQFHYPGLMWSGSSAPHRSLANASAADQADDGSTPSDLVSYFSGRVDECAQTLAEYQRNLAEIEAHLRVMESTAMAQSEALMAKRAARDGADGTPGGREDDLRNLAAVLADFERGILNIASKVGAAREAVVEVTVGSGTSV